MKTLMIIVQLAGHSGDDIMIKSRVVDLNDCLMSQSSVVSNHVSIECVPVETL